MWYKNLTHHANRLLGVPPISLDSDCEASTEVWGMQRMGREINSSPCTLCFRAHYMSRSLEGKEGHTVLLTKGFDTNVCVYLHRLAETPHSENKTKLENWT